MSAELLALRLLVRQPAVVGLGGLGEWVMPTEGFTGLAGRTALWLSYPVVLYAAGFLTREERERLRGLLRPSAVRQRLRELGRGEVPREGVEPHGGAVPETFEQANRDIDRP